MKNGIYTLILASFIQKDDVIFKPNLYSNETIVSNYHTRLGFTSSVSM